MTPTPFSTLSFVRRPLHRTYRLRVAELPAIDHAVPRQRLVGESPTRDSRYLRHWLAHQACLYDDLLQTIAAVPHGHP